MPTISISTSWLFLLFIFLLYCLINVSDFHILIQRFFRYNLTTPCVTCVIMKIFYKILYRYLWRFWKKRIQSSWLIKVYRLFFLCHDHFFQFPFLFTDKRNDEYFIFMLQEIHLRLWKYVSSQFSMEIQEALERVVEETRQSQWVDTVEFLSE